MDSQGDTLLIPDTIAVRSCGVKNIISRIQIRVRYDPVCPRFMPVFFIILQPVSVQIVLRRVIMQGGHLNADIMLIMLELNRPSLVKIVPDYRCAILIIVKSAKFCQDQPGRDIVLPDFFREKGNDAVIDSGHPNLTAIKHQLRGMEHGRRQAVLSGKVYKCALLGVKFRKASLGTQPQVTLVILYDGINLVVRQAMLCIEKRCVPVRGVVTRRLSHAYPIYTRGYQQHFDRLDDWVSRIDGLLSFGRQGLFAHDNTHHTMAMAYAASECLDDEGHIDRDKWRTSRVDFASHVVED